MDTYFYFNPIGGNIFSIPLHIFEWYLWGGGTHFNFILSPSVKMNSWWTVFVFELLCNIVEYRRMCQPLAQTTRTIWCTHRKPYWETNFIICSTLRTCREAVISQLSKSPNYLLSICGRQFVLSKITCTTQRNSAKVTVTDAHFMMAKKKTHPLETIYL